jgi:hypothetical protein
MSRTLAFQTGFFTTSVVPNILHVVPNKRVKFPLSVTHPELAKEADGWNPDENHSVGISRSWKCPVGHLYQMRIYDRKRGRKCAVCSGKQIQQGVNDLSTTHPELALQAAGWDPKFVTAGSHLKKDWVCKLGHKTNSTIKNRALLGNDCAVCTNQEVLAGFNDLAFLYPDIAKTLIDADPKSIIPGSNKKYIWKCTLGHEYTQSVNQRIQGQGCNICAGKRVLIGFNDLATTNREIAIEAYGWNPNEIFGGTHSRKAFKCSEGHVYKAIVKDRTVKGSGCPTCSKHGFNPGKPGFLYFLEHLEWEMFQIGITNNLDQRTKEHKKRGWLVIEVRGPIDGLLAMRWETAILQMLREQGADLSNEKIAGKFDGYSEAWSKSTFSVSSIKKLMEVTEIFEGIGYKPNQINKN